MPACSPTLVVAAALVDDLAHPRRLLSARRTSPAALAGGWELPGGKAEAGEAALDALHRETREELGIGIKVGDHVAGPQPDGTWLLGVSYRMHVWLAVIVDGTPQAPEDHDQLRWLTGPDLYAVPWLPADRPIVEALASRLHG